MNSSATSQDSKYYQQTLSHNIDYLDLKHHLDYQSKAPKSSLINQENRATRYRQLESILSNFYNFEDSALFHYHRTAMGDAMRLFAEDGPTLYIEENISATWLYELNNKSKIFYYQPDDIESLEIMIQRYGSGIILARSLSPYTGKFSNLKGLCKIRDDYDCFLIVNETNTLGLIGDSGKGLINSHNLNTSVDLVLIDLLPVFQVDAAIFLGKSLWISYLKDHSKHYKRDISEAKLNLDLLIHNFDLIKDMDLNRSNLSKTATYLYKILVNRGFDITGSMSSHIIGLKIKTSSHDKKNDIVKHLIKHHGFKGLFISNHLPKDNNILLTLHLNASATKDSLDPFICTLNGLQSLKSNI